MARVYPRVERLVRARLGAKLRRQVEVEDVVQETFLQTLLRIEKFERRDDATFADWLATIALNQIRAQAVHWSREKRAPDRVEPRGERGDDAVSRRIREISAHSTGPLSRMLRRERDESLYAALDELSEEQRESIALRHFAGMAFAEIAAKLGKPTEAAAREHYRRSRARLAIVLRRIGGQSWSNDQR
jgi:RNA polymerase sigma-70 factor (ECF subfamily)